MKSILAIENRKPEVTHHVSRDLTSDESILSLIQENRLCSVLQSTSRSNQARLHNMGC